MGSVNRTDFTRVLYMEHRAGQPALAGILAALVGFTSSSAVVLTGLRAVGATPSEAASGLLALLATQGAGMLWLSRRHRMPISLAWSTPAPRCSRAPASSAAGGLPRWGRSSWWGR